jgi:hypothetical protein
MYSAAVFCWSITALLVASPSIEKRPLPTFSRTGSVPPSTCALHSGREFQKQNQSLSRLSSSPQGYVAQPQEFRLMEQNDRFQSGSR